MEITEVRVRFLRDQGKVKALASITIDECFVVHDIRIIDKDGELFIAMPNKRIGNGEFRDIAHPINNQTRDYIEKVTIDKYKEELEKTSSEL